MVVTSHPAVTAAAVGVLRAGGNAVDAMLTAVPLQQVIEPQLSTIAGGFGMLHWDAATASATYLNANPDHATGASLRPQSGPDTSGDRVGVPATVAGMRAAADRFGTRPWDSYFAPAILAADDGFEVHPQLYTALHTAHTRITSHLSGRERYLPDGYLPPVGHILRQPKLAQTLRRISAPDGPEWFQRGPFAERFVAAVRETGGSMTRADLARYEPRWADPLRFTVAGHDVLGAPLPDTGGLHCAFALGVLERTELARLGPWHTSARAIALIARAQREAEAHVNRYGADPLSYDVPLDVLLSPDYLDATARLLDGSFPRVSLRLPEPDPASTGRPNRVGSNHLVIVDADGNWVTMLHTGYGTDFGTGLVVDGVGVNAAGYFPGVTVGPGRRIVAPLAPTLLLHDGRPAVGLGTPGFPPPCITLVLLNLLVYDMQLPGAVEAPRFGFETDDDAIAIETRVPPSTVAGLDDLGISTVSLGDHNAVTGRVNAVMRTPDGQLIGVVDSRAGGHAAGLT
jgi:gamma-glutamyltranspeptidase / glutathione hydrolase